MYKLYFKQAIAMLKQNKFISLIAILGTALAIMMIMAIIVSDNIKTISIGAEPNRYRTYYIPTMMERDTVQNSWMTGTISYDRYQGYLSDLQTPEYSTIMSRSEQLVCREGESEIHTLKRRTTGEDYWKIYSFRFIEGAPWGEEEVQSGVKHAILSESATRKLFKGEKAVGQMILINFVPYRVTGIVEDISEIFNMAHADLWIPYTSIDNYQSWGVDMLVLMAKNNSDLPEIDREVRQAEKKYDASHANKVLSYRGPAKHSDYQLSGWASTNEDAAVKIRVARRKSLFIFLVLLLVPAINLSGLSLSRMKRRTEEIGVRKAFGAKRHVILIQVLFENLITSLLGGVVGLLLSYGVIYQMKHWLLGVPEDSYIPFNALVSWPVLLSVVLVCVLLNLLSAGIPAYRASCMNIVNSLTQNDK
ncbi:ABC transporter permease [Parabacteroides sp. PF5-6]|uniref:ABC transporter permease n=1 Tax=Parabacteroides sp. PF5-6 TaxID=1742403 RepID=UPI0024050F40|nr:ABC transporter permease [Parabacteroides sp. PF5-6]MDF9831443.1 putative ABC transport system permease protein [Parabacteroides sp. PF5-6]